MKYYTFYLNSKDKTYRTKIEKTSDRPQDFINSFYDAKFTRNKLLFLNESGENINEGRFYESVDCNLSPKTLFYVAMDKSALRFIKSLAGSFATPMSKIITLMIVGGIAVLGLVVFMG